MKKGNKLHTTKKLEEHITIMIEPGSEYFGQIVPEDSTGSGIARSILNFMVDKRNDLRGIGERKLV